MDQLLSKLPSIQQWIDQTLARSAAKARPVATLGFARLSGYFSAELISGTKCVPVASVPMPPLSALGLTGFSDFENGQYDGITYKNTYFVRSSKMGDESFHFHELVHVVQWAHLGAEKFLTTYVLELLNKGYEGNRLEQMAYKHQATFDRGGNAYNAEKEIITELDSVFP